MCDYLMKWLTYSVCSSDALMPCLSCLPFTVQQLSDLTVQKGEYLKHMVGKLLPKEKRLQI